MDKELASRDRAMAEVAARQHGVVSSHQLHLVGIDDIAVNRRLRTGRLHRLHRGVYAVGHDSPSEEGRLMAAVLACGTKSPGRVAAAGCGLRGVHEPPSPEGPRLRTVFDHWRAAISHRSAAVMWGLLPPRDGPVDVSVPGHGGRAKRSGVRLHRSATIDAADVVLRNGIPVTTPARTIADLRRGVRNRRLRDSLTPRELRRAIRQAAVLGLPLGERQGGDRTRSDLEGDFLRLCRRHGLPAPEVNVRVGRDLVDFLWRDRRLVVETDGYLYHRGRAAFEDDRERDVRLRSIGCDVIRFSERQVAAEAHVVAALLRRALAA